MRRIPAVAGQFYPGQEKPLRDMLDHQIPPVQEPQKAFGVMVPHAGYIYSGGIAGETFSQITVPGRVVILGPNHHGVGHPAAVFSEGSWVTPLGESRVDEGLAGRILKRIPQMAADVAAHQYEHSLEVQLPFIQVLAPEAYIVPICLGFHDEEALLAMGEALGQLLQEEREEVLIVASSDMTHYESGDAARQKDSKALDRILALDPPGLYRVVRKERISMCGVIPAVVMLQATRQMGAEKAELVRYGNSGDVTGDQSQVVGYAGVVVS